MKRLAVTLIFCATALFADTAETVFFRGIMLPANEVPPASIEGSSSALIAAHIVRDDSGKIISGTVDFTVDYNFTGPVTFTGLHIHPAPAGVNGPVAIGTDIAAGAQSIVSATGVGTVNKPAQVINAAALNALIGMLEDPSQYYVNIHTTDFPGGAMRAQLQRAEVIVLMGNMSPANENPPIASDATGISQAVVITTKNADGVVTSGQVIFDIAYNFGRPTTVTGFHIHNGVVGINGPVIINTGISAAAAPLMVTAANGVGNFRKTVEVNMANPDQVATLNGLLTNPENYYINMHTVEAPGGLIRDQLRNTDLMTFNVTLLPSNETPPITGLEASAPSQVSIRTIRAEDGSVLAGTATFDVNYRFPPARVEFTGLHVHDGAAAVAGPVRLDSGLTATNTVVSESGFGNIYSFQLMTNANAVATLNSLVVNPENHYLNLHTTVNPGGAVRAQLGPANAALPAVTGGGNLANLTAAAPAGLITISGRNLTKVANGLKGWLGKTLPTSFHGTKLTIGGRSAPIIYVSPSEITAQVPVDVPAGSQPVIVTNSNGASAATNVTIESPAPAIFADGSGRGFVTHQGFDLVLPGNAARAGELLILWATGLGQTTPALSTGQLLDSTTRANTAPVTVTIGGQNAPVVYSIAAPGFAGLYQIAVTMPSGVASGNAPVALRMGTAAAASVNIAVQ